MTVWQAILLGVIQGLTEFIPISSTAHLTLAGKAMGLIDPNKPQQWTAFIAVIQLGTLLAVVSYFARDLLSMGRAMVVGSLAKSRGVVLDQPIRRDARLGLLVLLGTLPIGVAGLLLRDLIEGELTKNLWVIAGSLVGLAVLLTLAELTGSRRRDMAGLGWLDALVVGVAQVFALIPGSSRSGVTITGGLFAGLTRDAAARFSFLLSVPAIGASGLFELPEALSSVQSGWLPLVLATAVSGVFGYLSIAFLLRYLQTHTTFVFVAYRIAAGLLLVWLLASGRIGA